MIATSLPTFSNIFAAYYNSNHINVLNNILNNGGYVSEFKYMTTQELSRNAKKCIGFDDHINLTNELSCDITINTNQQLDSYHLEFLTVKKCEEFLKLCEQNACKYHQMVYNVHSMVNIVSVNNNEKPFDVSELLETIKNANSQALNDGYAGIDLKTFHGIVKICHKEIGKYLWESKADFLNSN